MRDQSTKVSQVSISIRIYKLLLTAYPSQFQREYDPQMLQLFQDCSLRACHQSGSSGIFSLWTITLFDFLSTVVEQHLQREINMTKEKFIHLSRWVLILAAVSLVAGFGIGGGETSSSDPLRGRDGFYEYGQLILIPASMLLFTIGMVGLRVRYKGEAGKLGNVGLIISIIGGALAFMAAIPLYVLWVVYDGLWWSLMIFSMLGLFTGLLLFGIDALRVKPFPRRNAVPLLTGIWFPLLGLTAILIELLGGSTESGGDFLWMLTTFFVVIGTITLGYLLQSDVPEKPIAAG